MEHGDSTFSIHLHNNIANLECHFKWNLDKCEKIPSDRRYKVLKKLEKHLNEPQKATFFESNLLLVFIESKREISKALQQVSQLQVPHEPRLTLSGLPWWNEAKLGYTYVAKCLEINFHKQSENRKQCELLLSQLTDFDKLSNVSKAAVWGTAGYASFLFGLYDQALSHFNRAVGLHPIGYKWKFGKGLALYKLRHKNNDLSNIEAEEQCFEEATKEAVVNSTFVDNTPKVFLAQTLREKVMHLKFLPDGNSVDRETLLIDKSISLYNELFEFAIETKNPDLLEKCLDAYNSDCEGFHNTEKAIKCITYLQKISGGDIDLAYHLGRVTEEKNDINAIRYYEEAKKSGDPMAQMALIKLKSLTNQNYDPTFDFMHLLASDAVAPSIRIKALCWQGDYLLKERKNSQYAIELLKKAMNCDHDGKVMKKLVNPCRWGRKQPVNYEKQLKALLKREINQNAFNPWELARSYIRLGWFYRNLTKPILPNAYKSYKSAELIIAEIPDTNPQKILLLKELYLANGKTCYAMKKHCEAYNYFQKLYDHTDDEESKSSVVEMLTKASVRQVEIKAIQKRAIIMDDELIQSLKFCIEKGSLESCQLLLFLLNHTSDKWPSMKDIFELVAMTMNTLERSDLRSQTSDFIVQDLKLRCNDLLGLEERNTLGVSDLQELRLYTLSMTRLYLLRSFSYEKTMYMKLVLGEGRECLDRAYHYMYKLITGNTSKHVYFPYVGQVRSNPSCKGIHFDRFPDVLRYLESIQPAYNDNGFVKDWFQKVNTKKHAQQLDINDSNISYYYNLAHRAASYTNEVFLHFKKLCSDIEDVNKQPKKRGLPIKLTKKRRLKLVLSPADSLANFSSVVPHPKITSMILSQITNKTIMLVPQCLQEFIRFIDQQLCDAFIIGDGLGSIADILNRESLVKYKACIIFVGPDSGMKNQEVRESFFATTELFSSRYEYKPPTFLVGMVSSSDDKNQHMETCYLNRDLHYYCLLLKSLGIFFVNPMELLVDKFDRTKNYLFKSEPEIPLNDLGQKVVLLTINKYVEMLTISQQLDFLGSLQFFEPDVIDYCDNCYSIKHTRYQCKQCKNCSNLNHDTVACFMAAKEDIKKEEIPSPDLSRNESKSYCSVM